MCKHRPTTIDGLKAAIRQTVNEILQEMTWRAMEIQKSLQAVCRISRALP